MVNFIDILLIYCICGKLDTYFLLQPFHLTKYSTLPCNKQVKKLINIQVLFEKYLFEYFISSTEQDFALIFLAKDGLVLIRSYR